MAGSYDLVGRITTLLPALAHLGAAHLIGDSYDTLPPRSRNEARATVSTARSVESYINEYREGAVAMHQAAAVVDFAGKPLIVLTAGRGHDATWQAATEQARHPSVGTADLKSPPLANGSAEFQSSASAGCTCHPAEASVASGPKNLHHDMGFHAVANMSEAARVRRLRLSIISCRSSVHGGVLRDIKARHP